MAKPKRKNDYYKKEDEYNKHVSERMNQNARIRGAKRMTRLVKDAKLPSERTSVLPTQKPAYAPNSQGQLPQNDFVDAIIRGKRSPEQIAKEKGYADAARARREAVSGVGSQTEANKRLRMTEDDLGVFREEKRNGLHEYADNQAGRNQWLVANKAEQDAEIAKDQERQALIKYNADPLNAPAIEAKKRQTKREEAQKDKDWSTKASSETAAKDFRKAGGAYSLHNITKEEAENLSPPEQKIWTHMNKLDEALMAGEGRPELLIKQMQKLNERLFAASKLNDDRIYKAEVAEATRVQTEAKTAQLLVEKEAKAAAKDKASADKQEAKDDAEARGDSLDGEIKKYTEMLKEAPDSDVARIKGILGWLSDEKSKLGGVEIPADILNPGAAGAEQAPAPSAKPADAPAGEPASPPDDAPMSDYDKEVADRDKEFDKKVKDFNAKVELIKTKEAAKKITFEQIKSYPVNQDLTKADAYVITAHFKGDKKAALEWATEMGYK